MSQLRVASGRLGPGIQGGALLVRLVTLALLSGCAGGAPLPKPADFPLHTQAYPVDFHWRLDMAPNVVQAEGLAQRRNHYIASARLQLLGLDTTGRVVSFTAPFWVAWRFERDLEPFTIRLRPKGGEERFEVRVYSFQYPEEIRREF